MNIPIKRVRPNFRPSVDKLESRTMLAATQPAVPRIRAEVRGVITQLLKTDQIPGIGVAVIKNGRVVLEHGYGRTGNPSAPKVTSATRFQVGSVTKTFTAISTLKIAQNSSLINKRRNPGIARLGLDKPISTYLPSGKPIWLPGLGRRQTFTLPTDWADVTPRELLDMSGGLPDDLNHTPWNQLLAQLVEFHKTTPAFAAGTQYLYSNQGFQILGALVEKLSGETYARFVQQHIFTPLGMTHAVVLQGQNRRVTGQAFGFQLFNANDRHGQLPLRRYYSGVSSFGAGSVVLSAEDLGTYMSALWKRSRRLLSPSMFQTMWTPVSLVNHDDPSETVTPGLGWDGINKTRHGTLIFKNGAVPGYQAQISLYETEGIGIAVAYNLTSSFFHAGNIGPGTIINEINTAIIGGAAAKADHAAQ